jgi:hypothetical protein
MCKWGKTQIVIREAIRDEYWRRIKFISNKAIQRSLTESVLDYLQIDGLMGDSPEAKKKREDWIEAYMPCVLFEHNEARVYANGRVKDYLFDYQNKVKDEPGKEWPTLDELEACFNRTIDLNTDRGVHVMTVYWDVMLPKACCNKHHWGETRRYYKTIMESKMKTWEGKMTYTVNPSTEAILMLCCKNNWTKWKKQFEVMYDKVKYPGCHHVDQVVKTAKMWDYLADDKIETEDHTDRNGIKKKRVVLKGPSFRTLYTNEKGQKEFHGGNEEGLNQYNAYNQQAKKLREGDQAATTLAFEKDFLEKLRAKKNLTEANSDAQRKANKKAKTNHTLAAVEEEKVEEMED